MKTVLVTGASGEIGAAIAKNSPPQVTPSRSTAQSTLKM